MVMTAQTNSCTFRLGKIDAWVIVVRGSDVELGGDHQHVQYPG